jgi:hypothetical protein
VVEKRRAALQDRSQRSGFDAGPIRPKFVPSAPAPTDPSPRHGSGADRHGQAEIGVCPRQPVGPGTKAQVRETPDSRPVR